MEKKELLAIKDENIRDKLMAKIMGTSEHKFWGA